MLRGLCRILESKMFKFSIGVNKKKYPIHGAAIARLSKPLDRLMNGPHKEAQELHVEWPDIDEETFVRFTQWAYTETYDTEVPSIVLAQGATPCVDNVHDSGREPSSSHQIAVEATQTAEKPLPSLESLHADASAPSGPADAALACCHNPDCSGYMQKQPRSRGESHITCIYCRANYSSIRCKLCTSVYSKCPSCLNGDSANLVRSACLNSACCLYEKDDVFNKPGLREAQCQSCLKRSSSFACYQCGSIFMSCRRCTPTIKQPQPRQRLIAKFLDNDGAKYPPSVPTFVPRKITESCENYSGVFMCHAKLYVIGDKYNIPELCQLSLHRLHVTLCCFELYPSRYDDIAIVTRYLFENTRSDDRIRQMMALFYACNVEHLSKGDTFQILMDETPGFAANLFSCVSERLA